MYQGDIRLGDTLYFHFTTRRFTTGAPYTLAGSPSVACYPQDSTTEVTGGITLTVDLDSRTGLNSVKVIASSGNGYATATNYSVVITAGTVDSVSVVGEVVGSFSIEARSALMPTVAGRTISVDASGNASSQLANSVLHGGNAAKLELGSSTSTPAFLVQSSGGDASKFSSTGGNGQGINAIGHDTGSGILGTSGGGSLAAGIKGIGTDGTAGDNDGFMGIGGGVGAGIAGIGGTDDDSYGIIGYSQASNGFGIHGEGSGTYPGINAQGGSAGPGLKATGLGGAPDIDGDITGNITGNLSGSVGSVTGNVGGNVVGSVDSVVDPITVGTNNDKTGYGLSSPQTIDITGNITGNLSGSVGSVTGAVGSVTGNVGGNVTGSVGSVLGNVGGNVVGSVDSVTDPVTVGTNNDKTGYAIGTGGITSASFAANAIDSAALANSAGQELADRQLLRSLATGSDGGRTVQDALRASRNRVSIDALGNTIIYQEDDTTPAWIGTATRDAAADPITEIDPA